MVRLGTGAGVSVRVDGDDVAADEQRRRRHDAQLPPNVTKSPLAIVSPA
jgi:hypothetical protein